MSVTRSWTTDAEVDLSDYERAYLDELMKEWSEIQTEIENQGFRRQAAYENPWEYDDPADHFDTDEELQAWRKREREREARRQVRLDVIAGILAAKGARPMRPYEHWNEDERYMQWMEEGRSE